MKLLDVRTGNWLEAEIARISEQDIQEIDKSSRFQFDWKKELIHEIYKIYLVKDESVVGLVALKDIPQEIRVHIQLIESSRYNTGKQKRIDRIPGCLIAFACELSFKKGYDGFVSLTPKTQLVTHYIKKYGFIQIGKNLAVYGEHAKYLILEYL
mgnify:CR=1 FL=1